MLSPSFSFPTPRHLEIPVEPQHVNKGTRNGSGEEGTVLCPMCPGPGAALVACGRELEC